MRYLFVFDGDESKVRGVVNRSGAKDVEIISVRKGTREPSTEMLQRVKNASIAAIALSRQYTRELKKVASLDCNSKEFRDNDQAINDWLAPAQAIQNVATLVPPSAAFVAESGACPYLILMPGCLKNADDLSQQRWPFASAAAKLLARLARSENVGNPRDWKEKYGAAYSRNGGVFYDYVFEFAGYRCAKNRVDIHLKDGDYTERTNCARVYYDTCYTDQDKFVLVFYVGPHPLDATYTSIHSIQQI